MRVAALAGLLDLGCYALYNEPHEELSEDNHRKKRHRQSEAGFATKRYSEAFMFGC